MEKSVTRGWISLTLAGIICKILGAFFRLPLTNLLGVKGIGAFQMIMSLYAFSLILCSTGFTTALSKQVSLSRAKNDAGRVNSLFKTSIIYSVLIGFLIGIVFLIFSKNISVLQGAKEAQIGYLLMIIILPLGAIIACLRGVIQGFEDMMPTAISQIIEQSLKFVFGLLFACIFVKKSVTFGVFGAILGITVSELFCTVYLLFAVRKVNVKFKGRQPLGFFKELFLVVLSMSILPFVSAIDSWIIVPRLIAGGIKRETALTLFGLESGVVGAVLNIPLILSTSISVAILPSLSHKLDYKETEKALGVLWILVLPMSLGIVAIASPLYKLIYPLLDENILSIAVNLTSIKALVTIITALMQVFVPIALVKGKLKYLAALQSFAGLAKILMVYFLCAIPEINIYGLVLANFALAAIVTIGLAIVIRKDVSIQFFDLTVPLFSSIIMLLSVKILVQKLSISPLLTVLLGSSLGAVIYIVLSLPCLLPMIKNLGYIFKKRRI